MTLAERLDALTALESTLLLAVAGALAGIVAILVARAAEGYSARVAKAAAAPTAKHVLDVVMEPRLGNALDPKVTLLVRCLAEPDADCRLACDEGCDWWLIERDEHGPFHLAYDEDDNEDEIEVRHPLRDVGAEYCGSKATVETEPELTFGGAEKVVLAQVPIDIRWESEDEVYWKVVGS